LIDSQKVGRSAGNKQKSARTGKTEHVGVSVMGASWRFDAVQLAGVSLSFTSLLFARINRRLASIFSVMMIVMRLFEGLRLRPRGNRERNDQKLALQSLHSFICSKTLTYCGHWI
jgi:hypothetical protein